MSTTFGQMAAPLALAVAFAVVAVWSRRGGRRVSAVCGVLGVACGLVAIRGLPQPVIVALLIAALGVVAVVTVWPWLARPVRARRAGCAGRAAGRRIGRGVS